MVQQKKDIAPAGAVLRRYWRHTARYPWALFLVLVALVVNQATFVIGPIYLKQFINIVAGYAPSAQNAALALAPLGMYALLSLIGWAITRFGYTGEAKLATGVAKDLTDEAFDYLMRHSTHFFAASFSGALTRRITRYRDAHYNLYSSFMSSIFPALIFIGGATAVLWLRHPILGIILLAWVVIFVGVQWALIRWQQPLRARRTAADSGVTAALADAITNHSTVQLFAGGRFESGRIDTAAEELRTANLKTWHFDILFYGVQGFLAIVANVGLLWVALNYWQQGLLTVGDLVLIQSYVFGILNNTWSIGREFRSIYTNLADAGEMVAILEQPHDIADRPNAARLSVRNGAVEFKDVRFYFQQESPVLHDFTLAITGGQKVALVGPSGAGKSTVTKLLLRLYDLPHGTISIDGQDIATVTQDSLREVIAFVPQEPILFHRTLLENIRYGRQGATDEEVVAAARAAHCEFIERLPEGYNTYVGERGIKLSGGERQRVAIARAVLKNAPILVLDEATSSLDSESESLIQDALTALMRGKTVLVIAHRLSTIMKMDRILVLERGRVVADGTHDQLLNQKSGLYHKLWSIQAGGFIGLPDEPNLKSITDDLTTIEEAEQEKNG